MEAIQIKQINKEITIIRSDQMIHGQKEKISANIPARIIWSSKKHIHTPLNQTIRIQILKKPNMSFTGMEL